MTTAESRATACRSLRTSLKEHASTCLLGFDDCPHVLVTLDLIDSLSDDNNSYAALLAGVPRPGASVEEEWAYAGPMLEEPTP